jgi:hypothetical protein
MKKILFFAALSVIIFVPLIAFAQSTTITINTGLPGQYNASSSIGAFISDFYTFALIISGILAFGAIVYGGIRYAVGRGNPSAESDARSWITNALLGLLLLAGAYVILYTINPALISLATPNLPGLSAVTSTSFGVGNPSGTTAPGQPGPRCQPPSAGPCSSAQLQGSCFGSNAQTAGGVCNVESNGNAAAKSGTDKCNDGSPVSIGLFQINISANTIGGLNCPSAFSNAFTGSNPHCTITNQSLYQQCVAAAMDASTNIQKACQLSGNGANFAQWGPATRQACGL